MIAVTTVVSNAFCENFTYFSDVLGLRQYEEKRGTVLSGRKLHKRHEDSNRTYVPRNLEGAKMTAAKFYSKRLDLVGIVDEAIDTGDSITIIERKFSNSVHLYDTHKTQIGLLALLIEENLQKPVAEARIIYQKDSRRELIVPVDASIKEFAAMMLERTKKVIRDGTIPGSRFDNRCLNCCYRRICPTGSLNMNQ